MLGEEFVTLRDFEEKDGGHKDEMKWLWQFHMKKSEIRCEVDKTTSSTLS